MQNFTIVTDCSCDMPADLAKELDVHIVPMNIVFDGKDYKHYHNWQELSASEYYSKLRDGAVGSTAGTNIEDAMDIMRPILKNGNDILYLSLSSGLSCSYQNACLAAEELREEYPNRKIKVVDTKCVCGGLTLLAYLVVKYKNTGASLEDTYKYAMDNCMKIHHSFVVDDLSALQRSGRISQLAAVMGTAIGVKPIFTIGTDGKVNNKTKVRGRKAGLRQITNDALEGTTDAQAFAICHADTMTDAENIKAQLLEKHPNAEIILCNIGPIIGINTGINTMAMIYIGEERT